MNNNGNLPAKPATQFDPELAQLLKSHREDLNLSLQDIKRMSSYSPGFSKREEIAAKAMEGMLSNSALGVDIERNISSVPKLAVKFADQLLKELDK